MKWDGIFNQCQEIKSRVWRGNLMVKFIILHSLDPIKMLVRIQVTLLPIQLSAVAWECSQKQPKTLGSCTCLGDLEEPLGLSLQIGAAPAIAQLGECISGWEIFLSVSAPLYIWLSNKNKIGLFKKEKF